MSANPLRTPAQVTAARAFPTVAWLDHEDALSAPLDQALAAVELTPLWDAACATDAGTACNACRKCGALLDAPCVTCSGKVTTRHRGRAA